MNKVLAIFSIAVLSILCVIDKAKAYDKEGLLAGLLAECGFER